MITTTANYDTENAKQNKFPIWTLEFDGVTTKFASGDYADISANHKKHISDVKINHRQEHFIDPRSGNSYCEVTLVDKDEDIVSLISSDNLFGISATIKQGFKALNEADFITPFIGRVEEIKLNSGEYTFVIEDVFPKSNDELFRSLLTTKLSDNLSKAFYNFTPTTLPNGGPVTVTVPVANRPIDQDLSIGDKMLVDTGATSEMVEIQSIDINNNQITFVSVASFHAAPSVTTKKMIIDNVWLVAMNTIRGSYTSPPFSSVGASYILVDQEIMELGTLDTTFGIATINVRGFDGTKRVSHRADADVKEVHYLVQQPLKLFLNFLTTTSAGTNGAYDIGLADWGLGIDEDLVDTAGILATEISYFGNVLWDFTFLFSQKENALSLIIDDILKPLGLFYFIGDSGKIKLGKIEQWDDTTSVGSYDDDDFSDKLPTLKYESVVNKIAWDYFYNWGDNSFRTTEKFNLSSSITEFGEFPEFDIISRGMRATTAPDFADELKDQMHRNMAKRYANPALLVDVKTRFENNLIELGDVLTFTHSHIPDYPNGARGITDDLGQVRLINSGAKNPDVQFEMQGKQYVSTGVYRVVSAADIDTTSGSNSLTNFNVTDNNLIQADDGKYDISAGINIDATRVTIKVSIGADVGETVSLTARVGTLVGPGMTVVDSETKVFSGGLIGVTGTFVFDGLALAKYDIKLDYFARTGGSPPNSVSIASLIYETDGAAYTAV